MSRKSRLTTLRSRVAEFVDDADEAERRIRDGEVLVGGGVVTNPGSMVPPGTVVAIKEERVLRGRRKLEAALSRWDDVPVAGAVALDAGAAAGGFTQALLEDGARRGEAAGARPRRVVGAPPG